MKVKDRMTPKPYTPDTCGRTWHLMQEKSSQVPVPDRGKLIGIITRRDFNARPELDLKRSSLATRFFPEEMEQN